MARYLNCSVCGASFGLKISVPYTGGCPVKEGIAKGVPGCTATEEEVIHPQEPPNEVAEEATQESNDPAFDMDDMG